MGKKTVAQSGRTASDPATLDELMQRLLAEQSAFRAFLRKRLSDDALVEDLLQHSLVKAVERGHELNNHDSAVSWFYRILRNAVVDYYRSHAADRRKVEGLLDELVTSGEDTMPGLDEVRPTLCACLAPLGSSAASTWRASRRWLWPGSSTSPPTISPSASIGHARPCGQPSNKPAGFARSTAA